MARIQKIEEHEHPELDSLIKEIKGKRGRLSSLYATLLQSPPIAAGWLHFLTAVRREGILDGRYRELVILRVALINHAPRWMWASPPRNRTAGAGVVQF